MFRRAKIWLLVAGAVGAAAAVPGVVGAAAPAPTVHYTFDGSLSDAAGGSTLTVSPACPDDPCISSSSFGTDSSGGFWTWQSTNEDSGGGFSVSTTASVGTTYTIALKFSFNDIDGYRKIIDYKDRASDNGFYFLDGVLLFYPFDEESASTYPADTVLDLIAVREATGPLSGTFTVYAVGGDGALTELFSVDDPDGESIPADNGAGGTLLGFFFDDLDFTGEATSGGKVYDLRIWADRALTPEEIEEEVLPPVTPPPATPPTTTPGPPAAAPTSASPTFTG